MDVDATTLPSSPGAPVISGSDIFGHPRGLVFIAGTEFWDRISFTGMQALLVLYMAEELLRPGHIEKIAGFAAFRAVIEAATGPLSAQSLALQIFGFYIGLVYLLPVFGGLLGDRVLGRRNAVALGALLMTAGHFCMAFDRSFLLALLLLILGAGALRGNLASQLGDLYSKSDRRRESAFQIYYAMLNTGGFIAPLITGELGQKYGWHYGFGFAGVGMLVGLVVYLSGSRHLPPRAAREGGAARMPLTSHERRIVRYLALMLPMLTLFWIGQAQIWDTYNLWARDHVDMMVAGWKMPVPWLQSIDALGAVVMVPPILWFWRWQAAHAREPDDLTKIGHGCLLFAVAIAWLALAGRGVLADATGKVPLWCALLYHFLSAIGYLYFAPVVIAFFSRSAPAAVNAMMLGVYYVSIFAGSTISGRLGGLYERLSSSAFWLMHAALVAAGGILILLFAKQLRRGLAGAADGRAARRAHPCADPMG